MSQVPSIFAKTQEQPRTVASFPCLDWLGTHIPRMICPHCNSAVESTTAAPKKPLAIIKVIGPDGKEYAVQVNNSALADALAEGLHAHTIVDGTQIQVHGTGALIVGGRAAGMEAVQTYTYSDQWLALNMGGLHTLSAGDVFIMRVTPDWNGMHIVYYHFDSLPSMADIEAKNAQYSPEYLEQAYKAYRDSIYTHK